MQIFFLCRTGHHTALIAAMMYLQGIGKNELSAGLTNVPGYDQISTKEIGTPYFVGKDKSHNMVYTMGVSGQSSLLARAAHELVGLIGVSPGDFRIIDTSPFVSSWTDIGLFFKRLRLKYIARLFFYLGVSREQASIKKLLAQERELLS